MAGCLLTERINAGEIDTVPRGTEGNKRRIPLSSTVSSSFPGHTWSRSFNRERVAIIRRAGVLIPRVFPLRNFQEIAGSRAKLVLTFGLTVN